MDSYKGQISSFKRGVNAAWEARFEVWPSFVRIAFLVFLGAIVIVGLYGGRKTLWYILLVIALFVVTLPAYMAAAGQKKQIDETGKRKTGNTHDK